MMYNIWNNMIHVLALGMRLVHPAANGAFIALAFFLAYKGKKAASTTVVSVVTQCCYVILCVLTFENCIVWMDYLYPMAIAIMPVFTFYSSGYYYFQAINFLSIYFALNEAGMDNAQHITCILMHAYLSLTHLDSYSNTVLQNIKHMFLYTQERHLLSLSRLRKITLSDIEKLPKHMQLGTLIGEFNYNVDEPMFLIRAIVRMMWKPMIPLYILGSVLAMLSSVDSLISNRVLQILDSSNVNWNAVYLTILIEFTVNVLSSQSYHVQSYIDNETERAGRALEFEMFRLPLVSKHHYGYTDYLSSCGAMMVIHHLKRLHKMVTALVRVITHVTMLYMQIGWLILIPVLIKAARAGISWALTLLFGSSYEYMTMDMRDLSNFDTDEIYHNIRSIKMFGWENLYLDPKLKVNNMFSTDSDDKKPWYAPIAKISWSIFGIFDSYSQEISTYLSIYIYCQYGKGTSKLSNADIIHVDSTISSLDYALFEISDSLSSISKLVERIYEIEVFIKGKATNTLPHILTKDMDSVVTVDNGEFKWDSNTVAAKDVSFTAIPGDLVAVVGDTGSGKSSLLSSLCSEVEMTKGTGSVIGSVAYVEQSPWIMNGTLRDNILFGQEFDKEHYNKILYSCAFANDVKTWKYGDLTVIGERGINISGGQKARLALARALYARADIYILDDPLSAVDAHVKRHILDHVIMSSGMLKDRICIMSLNDRNILPYFNKVLTVDDCCVTFQDQIAKEYHSPIMVDPASTEFVYATDTGTINDNNKVSKEKESLKMNKYSILDNTRYIIKLCGIPILALLAMASLVHPIMSYIFDELKLDALNDNTNNIDIAGRNPALRYIYIEMARRFADNIRWKTMNTVKDPSRVRLENKLIYEFGSSLIHAPLSFYDSRIRQRISTDKDNIQQLHMGIDYYISENVNTTLSAILALYKICFNKPHILLVIPFLTVIQVMKNILIEPLETFLNEIETESNVEKEKISDTIADGKHLIRIFGVGRHFIGKYIANVDERQSIELPKSNLDDFQLLLYCFANEILSMLSKFCLLVISNYSGQRLTSGDFITYNQLTGTLISNIVILADISKDIQKVSTNVDLLREYTDVELEKMFVDGALQPEGVWPATGEIEFKDFSMKYRSDLEYSLKNINLTIHPGEKIGIVGRTGAGKSSLARVIFCLVNSRLCSGSILIDGCDISKMNLGYLRPKIGIIPQEPTLFSSTFKKNLDPLEEHTIEDMWAGIIKCGIAELIQPQKIARDADADADDQTWLDYLNKDTQKKIDEWNQDFKASSWTHKLFMLLFITKSKLRTEVLVHGTMPHGLDRYADMDYDFSGGQKQLFSLCRLLIRQHKVIVLDEATASVDLDTDQDMQKLIRSEFKESTVLTIAHRLETIMNSDRIIVMDKGEIVEVGPPDELLQNGGYFSELAKANDFGE